MGTEIFVKLRIGGNVGFVVPEQIQLNLVIPGPVQKMLVECVTLRGDPRGVCLAMLVLKLRRPGLQERAEIVPVFFSRFLPLLSKLAFERRR
jgi:hypothetical protein